MKYIACRIVMMVMAGLWMGGCGTGDKKPDPASVAGKPALMWFDAEANFERFSHKDSIDYYLLKIKALGFTHAIVDIRPITGEVLYESAYAPQMKEWDGYTRKSDFDYLGYFIEKGHELGLEVHASLNVFVAGHNFFDRGQVYDGHPGWSSMVYTPDQGNVPITSLKKKYSAMVNPVNQEFREHILAVLRETVSRYPDLDGIMLDRVRYDGIMADFSDLSRMEFEKFIGEKIAVFPEDIYEWKSGTNGQPEVVPGVHYKKWLEWRAMTITQFMGLARDEVKAVNPDVSFGTYTGAWYPSYYEVGANWASRNYDPSADYAWATPDYKNSGYAEMLDLYVTGNYYTQVTMEEYLQKNQIVVNETDSRGFAGTWYCVEGSCQKIRGILHGNPFMGGILVDQFYDNPVQLSRSIAMNLLESDGVMLFDIVHVIHGNLWDYVAQGFEMARKGEIPPLGEGTANSSKKP